jgi:hypothetical protein
MVYDLNLHDPERVVGNFGSLMFKFYHGVVIYNHHFLIFLQVRVEDSMMISLRITILNPPP